MSRSVKTPPCPCGSGGTYARCCGPLHDGATAPSAEALMRSRYSAYVLGLETYLLATWHASSRPQTLGRLDDVQWLGLSVLAHRQTDSEHAEVHFSARFRARGEGGGRAQRLEEHSRFVREQGRWLYLDAQIDGHPTEPASAAPAHPGGPEGPEPLEQADAPRA